MLKLEIRGRTIPYCSNKKAKMQEKEKKLEQDILCLEQELCDTNNHRIAESLQHKNTELGKNLTRGHISEYGLIRCCGPII